jgi:hypothetical protein
MRANSSSSEPNAQNASFKPSEEVQAKMKPLERESFFALVKRAANSPALKSGPKAK